MMTPSRWHKWIRVLVAAAISVPPLLRQAIVAQDPGAKRPAHLTLMQTRTGRGIAQINGFRVAFMLVTEAEAGEAEFRFEGDHVLSKEQVTVRGGSLDELIFGDRDRNETGAHARLVMLLNQKINAVDRICDLNDMQREKMRLAGRGDVKRILDRAEKIRAHFGNMSGIGDMDEFVEWARALFTETQTFRPILETDPFERNSIFGKALVRTLTREQAARYARAPAAAR